MNGTKILVMVVMTSLFLTALAIPSEVRGEDISRELKSTHMNLKADDKLSPEFNHKPDTEPQTKNVKADYQDYYVVIADSQWVDVGTWTSEGIDGDMTVSGTVFFNLWFMETSNHGNGNDHNWQFDFQYNGETIAHAECSSEGSTTEVREVTTQADISETINAKSGDCNGRCATLNHGKDGTHVW